MSGRERHTKRQTKRARTTELGALQRRILLSAVNRMWDVGQVRDGSEPSLCALRDVRLVFEEGVVVHAARPAVPA